MGYSGAGLRMKLRGVGNLGSVAKDVILGGLKVEVAFDKSQSTGATAGCGGLTGEFVYLLVQSCLLHQGWQSSGCLGASGAGA